MFPYLLVDIQVQLRQLPIIYGQATGGAKGRTAPM